MDVRNNLCELRSEDPRRATTDFAAKGGQKVSDAQPFSPHPSIPQKRNPSEYFSDAARSTHNAPDKGIGQSEYQKRTKLPACGRDSHGRPRIERIYDVSFARRRTSDLCHRRTRTSQKKKNSKKLLPIAETLRTISRKSLGL